MESKKTMSHIHPAYVGSELACRTCNPHCPENHKFGNQDKLNKCCHPQCPLSKYDDDNKKPEKPKKQNFYSAPFHVQTGDIITSKEGILLHHPLSKEFYLVKKLKVIGKGHSVVIGDKEKIDVIPIKEKKQVTRK